MSAPPFPDAPRLDTAAVRAVLRRLSRQEAPPWLHGEVARRMAERLLLVKTKPERIADWWSFLGAGGPMLQQAYPDALRIAVEPNTELLARSRAAHQEPWWSPQRWRGRAAQARAETDELDPPVQLVWANMMLHGVQDPFALFAQLGPVDPAHAFYLGYELARAATALSLGKNYVQDEPLNWGFLTRPEPGATHGAAGKTDSTPAPDDGSRK